MCLRVRLRFNSITYRRIHNTSTFKRFSWVVRHCVIYNNESARRPSIGTLIFFHILAQVLQDFVRQGRAITKYNSFLRIITFVNPTCVCSNNLVEKSLISIRTNSDCWQYWTNNSAVAVRKPFTCSSLLCHFSFCLLLSLNVIHRLPTSTQCRWSVILFGSYFNVFYS